MVEVWIAIGINFGLSLLILKRLSQLLAGRPEPITIGPLEGTRLTGGSRLGDLATTGRRRLVIALSSSCPGCRRTRSELLTRERSDDLDFIVLSLDDDPESELASDGLPVLAGSAASELISSLEVNVTPSYYLVDDQDTFLEAGHCRGARWDAFFV